MTRILVTGADGFIGRNLLFRLREQKKFELYPIGRNSSAAELANAASRADFVFHLAGVNRPMDAAEFVTGNVDFTTILCTSLREAGNAAPIAYSSSTSAGNGTPYGESKQAAEDLLMAHGRDTGSPIHIFRLPNVFGKWARPNYNSAIATFCHNTAHGEPIEVHDPAASITLAYIDDVVDAFIALMLASPPGSGRVDLPISYQSTVGEVAQIIRSFPGSRDTLTTGPVGTGLCRALYATYLSYLQPHQFSYLVPVHGQDDPRGIFVEMLKTPEAGQFSYFIAHPGVTRGDHYHHSKSEKFLVIQGRAHFGFRHVDNGATHELTVNGGDGRIVETIPGWTHNITNIGDNDLICMLWANEIFDPERPDTVAMKVSP